VTSRRTISLRLEGSIFPRHILYKREDPRSPDLRAGKSTSVMDFEEAVAARRVTA
jgi:hypothetical protein